MGEQLLFTMIFKSILSFCMQKHARRVYEILRLRNTDMSDEQKAREFRLEVKKRLFGPYRVGVFTFTLQHGFLWCIPEHL